MAQKAVFELKQSPIHGVGVFAVVDIKKGTALDLFHPDDNEYIPFDEVEKTGIPESLIEKHSICGDEGYSGPKNFHQMSIGWYLNHSDTPNAEGDDDYNYFAAEDIKEGEEITIDYEKL